MAWVFRSRDYKCAVFMLFAGTLFYFVGYASPYWVSNSAGDHAGLWSCSQTYDARTCGFFVGKSSNVAWIFKIVAFQTGGFFGMFFSCTYVIMINFCCQCVASRSPFLALVTFLSAVLSFASLFIFYYDTFHHMTSAGEYEIGYGWASYFSATGCCLVICSCGGFCIAGWKRSNPPLAPEAQATSQTLISMAMEVHHARNCPYAAAEGLLSMPGAVFVKQLGNCADVDQPSSSTTVPA